MRLLLPAVIVLAACNTTQTRTVQGRLTGTSQQAVVFSESTSGQQTVTAPGADGTFTLQVPTDEPVTLLVGVQESGRPVRVLQHIGPHWFRLQPGPTINLGTVRPEGGAVGELAPVTEMTPQQCPSGSTEADLPYDAKVSLGQTWKLADAFAEKGPQPPRVVDVTMEGTPWRLAELNAGTPFTITQADCDHTGNRDVGRDRVFVTWENADGSRETDHLDMRYCESDDAAASTPPDADDAEECEAVVHEGCGTSGSSCDDDSELVPVEGLGRCPGQGPAEGAGGAGSTPIN